MLLVGLAMPLAYWQPWAPVPPLLLAPVNFDALYMQHLQQQTSQGSHSIN